MTSNWAPSVPLELRSRDQWIAYKTVRKLKADGSYREDKVPFDVETRTAASVTDPCTWSTYEAATEFVERHHIYSGVGIVLTERDSITAIDLDDCIDEDEKLTPFARDIVDCFDSYTEVSPSGKGLHIFVYGQLPGTRRRVLR